MSMSIDPKNDSGSGELLDEVFIDRLMSAASDRGMALTGEGGFLPELIMAVLERGMKAELTSHLGYEKNDPDGRVSGNSRNGSSLRTVQTEVGPVQVDAPVIEQARSSQLYYQQVLGAWGV